MRAVALAALALALCVPGARAQEMPLDLAGYASELRAMEAALASGALEEAAERAQVLRGRSVEGGGERFTVDPTLLDAVAAARVQGAHPAALRVRAVLRALEAQAPPAPAPSPDPALLRRLQEAQRPADLPLGGEVGGLPPEPSLPQQFLDGVAGAWGWLRDAGRRLWEWLLKLWPRRQPREQGSVMTNLVVTVLVIAVALVMALLALTVLRRSQPAAAAETSAPEAAGERDEDPLSREQDEWESYAARLAASGRQREAIRAWYHAVLVALFRGGLLHHHKGRTNWEYVARVPPEQPWRAGLIRLTRRFDSEWYGRERSSTEALHECAEEARAILRQVRQRVAA